MTDKRDISRRSALKGIAGTGAIVGGLGLAGSASAKPWHQDPKDQIDDVSFNGCKSVTITFEKGTVFPVKGIQFDYYDEKKDAVMTVTPKIRYKDTKAASRKHKSKRRRYTFAGGYGAKKARMLSVSVGKKTYENPDHCRKKRDGIDLEGVCYKKKKNRAKFRVENHNKKPVKVSWKELDGKQSSKLTVPKKGSETFWVGGVDRKTKVALYYGDDKIDVEKVDGDGCEKGH